MRQSREDASKMRPIDPRPFGYNFSRGIYGKPAVVRGSVDEVAR